MTYRFRNSSGRPVAVSTNFHKRERMKTALLLATAALFAVDVSAQGRIQRPMTFEDFAAVRNVGDPQISPDGNWVLYSVRTTDVNANKRTTVTRLARVGIASDGDRVEPPALAPSQFPN